MQYKTKQNELIKAYKATEYRVFSPSMTISIGKVSDELDNLLKENNEEDWAFVTSCNPFGRDCSMDENNSLYDSLLKDISKFKYFEGEGQGIDSTWAPEKSILIIGISKSESISIGNKYNQNAILIGKNRNTAELLLLDAFEKVE